MNKKINLASETSKAPNRFAKYGKGINAILARVVSGRKKLKDETALKITGEQMWENDKMVENEKIELEKSSIESDESPFENETAIEPESMIGDEQTDDESIFIDDRSYEAEIIEDAIQVDQYRADDAIHVDEYRADDAIQVDEYRADNMIHIDEFREDVEPEDESVYQDYSAAGDELRNGNIPKPQTLFETGEIIKEQPELRSGLPVIEEKKSGSDKFSDLQLPKKLIKKLKKKNIDLKKILSVSAKDKEIQKLQNELLKLERWVTKNKRRVVIIFEGYETAGKFAAIKRLTKRLNPRSARVVSLPHPTAEESGQWYFQRYVKELPNAGEIVIFNRSWYSRAIVEPVNEICTGEQYGLFLKQTPEFEYMLHESGIDIVKFWFSISKEKSVSKFDQANSTSDWNLHEKTAAQIWDEYTHYKNLMFSWTSKNFSPWMIVEADDKKAAQIESIKYVLSRFDYDGKENANFFLEPDPAMVSRFHRFQIAAE